MRVNTVFGIITFVVTIRVIGKKFWVNYLARKLAAYRERIANHVPLRFAKQAEHFTQVVYKTCEYEPIGMPVRADGLGGLQQMLQLIEVSVRVGVIYQRI